jgi:GPH family glycoside/pentoside/hexuronide:cation symporter
MSVKANNRDEKSKEESTIEFEDHLPLKSKVMFGVLNGAHGLLSGIGLGSIDYFFKIVFKNAGVDLNLAGDLIGLAWMLFMVWNAVNDPLFGIIEDKTHSKLGRRIPYLRYGSIIYCILFILIWFPIPTNDPIIIFLNLLAMLAIFDTIFTIIGLVTFGLPAEMAITSKGRASIFIWSTIVGAPSTILGFILPALFLTNDNFNLLIFQIVMIITGVICSIIMYIASYYIKENEYTTHEESFGFKESIIETFKNKPFLINEINLFFTTMGNTILTGTGILFIIDYVLKTDNLLEYLKLAPALVVAGISIYYFNKNIQRFGIKKIFIFGASSISLGFLLFFFLGSNFITAWIPVSLILNGFAINLLTSQNLFSDTIDYDEVRTGKRRETSYSGVNALITKPAISIAKWLFFLIIGLYTFETGELDTFGNPIKDYLSFGILLAFSIIPAICYGIAALAICKFPLDGPEWQKQKRALQQIHMKKEEEYVKSIQDKIQQDEIRTEDNNHI